MDVLVYSNIKDVYKNTDTLLALKTLALDDLNEDQIRWACKLDYIHTGNVLAEAFNLNKSILSKCATYYEICNDSNAVNELMKVSALYNAFEDDININLDVLGILQNNKELALGYLQQPAFLQRVCQTKATLRALVKDQDYCNVVQATINNYRDVIANTLSSTTYTQTSIGSGSGTWTQHSNKANLIIAYNCYDDSDTDYSIYHGNGAYRVAYVGRHSGNKSLGNTICLRGIKLVGSGASVGRVDYRLYNL